MECGRSSRRHSYIQAISIVRQILRIQMPWQCTQHIHFEFGSLMLTFQTIHNKKQTKYAKYISIHLQQAITVKYCTRISHWRCVIVLFKCMSQTHTIFCLPNGLKKKNLRRFVFEVCFDLVPENMKSHTLNVNAKFKFY